MDNQFLVTEHTLDAPMHTALGITEARKVYIQNLISDSFETCGSFGKIMHEVSKQVTSANELVWVGFLLGGYAEYRERTV